MGKGKLKKFADLNSLPNVFQNYHWESPYVKHLGDDRVLLKGKWRSDVFKNENPLILELACGKGEYSVGLGERYPDKNFVGVDLKGNRIWNGAQQAVDRGLNNVAFLRTRIELIEFYFEPNEVDEIWITFPDPYLRKSRSKKRLTSSRFLALYKPILKDGGFINLKTDSQELYEFTKEVIEEEKLNLIQDIPDVYAKPDRPEILNIKTYYEKMHLDLGKAITYLKYTL